MNFPICYSEWWDFIFVLIFHACSCNILQFKMSSLRAVYECFQMNISSVSDRNYHWIVSTTLQPFEKQSKSTTNSSTAVISDRCWRADTEWKMKSLCRWVSRRCSCLLIAPLSPPTSVGHKLRQSYCQLRPFSRLRSRNSPNNSFWISTFPRRSPTATNCIINFSTFPHPFPRDNRTKKNNIFSRR